MWGATETRSGGYVYYLRFNSRTPCGVRLIAVSSISECLRFQFTHPVWGATTECYREHQKATFQFTHPVWGATQGSDIMFSISKVSIHAPRVGCDYQPPSSHLSFPCFNSRTPCGVRPSLVLLLELYGVFQFTHPVWGATLKRWLSHDPFSFQFTHPVWGATPPQWRSGRW